MALALACAAGLVLLPAAHAALTDAERMLHRSSADGTLPGGLATLHTRFGTPARAIDVTAAAMILVILASGGRVTWLARAYADRDRRHRSSSPLPRWSAFGGRAAGRRAIQDARQPAPPGPRAAHWVCSAPASIVAAVRADARADRRWGVDRGRSRWSGRWPRGSRWRHATPSPRPAPRSRTHSTCCRRRSSRSIRSRHGPATCWCQFAIRMLWPTSSPRFRPPAIEMSW